MIKDLPAAPIIEGKEFHLRNCYVETPKGKYWIPEIIYDEENRKFGLYVGGKLIATLKESALLFKNE